MSVVISNSRVKAKTVMGIDASTQSIAFAVLSGQDLVSYGKVSLDGADVFERIHDAKGKTKQIIAPMNIDYIVLEAAVMVRSVSVAVKLAYVFGVIIAELMDTGARVETATPIQWQMYIGNGFLSAKQKAAMRKEFPGQKPSWYSNKGRQVRKQFTIDYFNDYYGIQLTDDDVADALGLAHYAARKIVV